MQTAPSRWVLSLVAIFVLFTALCEAQVIPAIQIQSVPAYGAVPGRLSGRVLGVNPTAYNVTALVFISGLGFYTKPYCNATTTPLAADGSFTVLLTTGGIDQYATLIAVLVIPASATVPCSFAEPGVPAALEQQAVAKTLVPRPNPNQREIQFSGETWVVKSSPAPVGPGPNYFSDSQENVWVDNLGRLHLRITNRGGVWYCAEVVSKRVIGYGRYTVQVDSPPQFDKNVVFGAFSWADAERISREVDMLELGRFGNANDPNNAQNVVQPYTTQGNQFRFFLPQIAPTVHKMTWLPDTLNFQSSDQFGGLLHQWTYGGQPTTTESDRLNFRFNLWLFGPPSDSNEAEIIVNRFSFTPVSKAGVFRSGFFWAIDSNRSWQWDASDKYVWLGQAGDVPVAGDFDADGVAEIGIFRSGFWAIDLNHNGQWDAGDLYIWLGQAGDIPVVGDFNGDGRDEMGVFRSGFWAIDLNHNGQWDVSDKYVWLGQAGDSPVVGDFDGDGIDEMGVFRSGFWAIDMNRNGAWDVSDKYVWLGQAGDIPLVSDFNGDGISAMGVFRSGFWAIDMNRNGTWDATDGYHWLGQAGDVPVVLR